MNRKQRRAAQGQVEERARRHRRAVALNPNDARAQNELACALLQRGELQEAAAHFARAVTLAPESLEQYRSVVATLLNVNPTLRAGMARLTGALAREIRPEELFGPGDLEAISRDPFLRCVLESTTVRDLDLERYLTSARRLILDIASDTGRGNAISEPVLELCCSLAKQCFINEYVFDSTCEEMEKAGRLRDALAEALVSAQGSMQGSMQDLAPMMLVATASYFPLSDLPHAPLLLQRPWPSCVRSVLAQQIAEPEEERQLRETIPRLTPIADDVSLRVRQQYEENPYPRWVRLPRIVGPMEVEAYLRDLFPGAALTPNLPEVAAGAPIEVLVAGCGTGRQSIVAARRFGNARVLAVDLSLASLCYAKRMSRAFGAPSIEYAQADILELPSLGRTFHVIEASGVLHHFAEPMAGWRTLLSLLRPGGFMRIGLYSKSGRAQIQAARDLLAQSDARPTANEIRRWRRKLLSPSTKAVANFTDFFSISECRDLLFHVQEHQLSIPEIEAFLRDHNLRFIGFELHPPVIASYRFRFPEDRAMASLGSWHVFEKENPLTFAGMYQFWVQHQQ